MQKKLDVKIQLRRATEEQWATSQIQPLEGEPIIYTSSDGYKLKFGDGVSTPSQLPFFNDLSVFNDLSKKSTHNVLWLGTSISSGDGPGNNYPEIVARKLGFNLYNNSQAGSFVSYMSAAPGWTTSDQVSAEFATGYCLSATHAEVETKYRSVLNTIRRNEGLATSWVDNWINDFKARSFESLVVPYIDGSIAACDTVIIDHGFNDRDTIFNIVSQYANAEKDIISYWPEAVVGQPGIEYPVVSGNSGWYWLTQLGDDRYYDSFELMKAYWGLLGFNKEGNSEHKLNYFVAMMYIVQQIWKINPRVKIIIGNYFSKDHGFDSMSSFKTKYILEANKQFASLMGFYCVNPAEHTGLRNRQIILADGTSITDMRLFCPDGVHPHSDPTGHSNRVIADVYTNELVGLV